MQSSAQSHPYAKLTPDWVMDAIESLGYLCSAQVMALNSYENRVYQIGIEDSDPIIAKFYRPNRWSKEAIAEEHDFCHDLMEHEISLLAPLKVENESVFEYDGFYFALFKRQGGHAPETSIPDTLYRIGMNIGRIHSVGTGKSFKHRPTLNTHDWGEKNISYLLSHDFIPSSLHQAYESLTRDLTPLITKAFENTHYKPIRLHGDCHIGNILWRDDTAFFVDFDDCMNGPAIQDLWLLLNGDRQQKTAQLMELIEGYEEFCDFDAKQLRLIEALRTLRLINYSTWLARRWDDPAFPMYFPWFNTDKYWSEHILELREQFAAMNEEPLSLTPY